MSQWLPRAVLVPVLWYVGGTLVVPLLNGAAWRTNFWNHAAVVLLVAGAVALLACAVHAVRLRAAKAGRLRGRGPHPRQFAAR